VSMQASGHAGDPLIDMMCVLNHSAMLRLCCSSASTMQRQDLLETLVNNVNQ
jgi:hypothetical protein